MQRCMGEQGQCKREMPPPEMETEEPQVGDLFRLDCPDCGRLHFWRFPDPTVPHARGRWEHVPRVGEGQGRAHKGAAPQSKG